MSQYLIFNSTNMLNLWFMTEANFNQTSNFKQSTENLRHRFINDESLWTIVRLTLGLC